MREKERGKYVIDVRPWGYKGKRVRLPFEGGYEDALRYHNEVLAQFGRQRPHLDKRISLQSCDSTALLHGFFVHMDTPTLHPGRV